VNELSTKIDKNIYVLIFSNHMNKVKKPITCWKSTFDGIIGKSLDLDISLLRSLTSVETFNNKLIKKGT
jgi:hypothetical protein